MHGAPKHVDGSGAPRNPHLLFPELTHYGYAMKSALLSISSHCWIPLVIHQAAVLLCILDSSVAIGRPLNSAWNGSILKAYAELAHPLAKAVIRNREILLPRLATSAWIGAQSGNATPRPSRSAQASVETPKIVKHCTTCTMLPLPASKLLMWGPQPPV